MEVQLTPDQKAFIKHAIEAGRFNHEEDALKEALSLWEERERQRAEFLASLIDANASLARGEGRRGPVTTRLQQMFFDTVGGKSKSREAWLARV